MSLSDRKPFQACGKAFASVDAAERYRPVIEGRREVVEGCPCGKVHTQAATEKPRTPLRPQGRSDGIPQAVRKLVLDRDGFRCVYCGYSIIGFRYSLGHRVRESQGGEAVPENLMTVHGWGGESCHGSIDLYKDPMDNKYGYRLWSWQDPAAVPVLVRTEDGGEAWMLLGRDGSATRVAAPEQMDGAA